MLSWSEITPKGSKVLSIHYSFGDDRSCSGEALYNKETNAFILVQSPKDTSPYVIRSFLESIQKPLRDGTLGYWQVTAIAFREWRTDACYSREWSKVHPAHSEVQFLTVCED